MAEAKTKPTSASVEDHLAQVAPSARQADTRTVCDLMQRLRGHISVTVAITPKLPARVSTRV
jgi:hypothetical protein